MKKQFIKAILFTVVLLAVSCKEETVLEKWKDDKRACNGIRSVTLTHEIIKEYILDKASFEQIKEMFGEPDKEMEAKMGTALIYYIENNCSTDEKDVCTLTIYDNQPEGHIISITCT